MIQKAKINFDISLWSPLEQLVADKIKSTLKELPAHLDGFDYISVANTVSTISDFAFVWLQLHRIGTDVMEESKKVGTNDHIS